MKDGQVYRVLMVGAGKRATDYYCPMMRRMGVSAGPGLPGLDLVGISGRRHERTQALADRYGVPAFTDLGRAIEETRPDLAVVAVSFDQNGPVGLAVVRAGVSLLAETPVSADPAEGMLIAREARRCGAHVEVTEQNFRIPEERLKRKLIEAGLFGRVLAATNDFKCHGYHGTSMIRHYIGFDDPVRRVIALGREFRVEPHHSELDDVPDRDRERWLVGLIEFDSGAIGTFSFTDITYDAPMRWRGHTKFFGEKGTAVGEEILLCDAERRHTVPFRIERDMVAVDDDGTVGRVFTRTDPPVEWKNPHTAHPWDEDRIGVAECFASLLRAMQGKGETEYGAENGAVDQAIAVALEQSARNGGEPVEMGEMRLTIDN